MSTTEETQISLKILVDKARNKVLFAEVDANFVKILFSFLTLPMGTIVRLVGGEFRINVSVHWELQHFLPKLMLKPPLPRRCMCKNQIFRLKEARSYYCYLFDNLRSDSGLVTGYTTRPPSSCGKYNCLTLKDPKRNGEFVRGTTMFMVTNDLVVTPFSSISTITYLRKLDIHLCEVEECELSIDIDEGLDILKASLTSSLALSSALKHLLLKKPKQEK